MQIERIYDGLKLWRASSKAAPGGAQTRHKIIRRSLNRQFVRRIDTHRNQICAQVNSFLRAMLVSSLPVGKKFWQKNEENGSCL
jgi:hypothetical protein